MCLTAAQRTVPRMMGEVRPAAIESQFSHVPAAGQPAPVSRALADEVPIAIECNGLAYAVLMATPAAVEELAVGFALGERLIDGIDDVRGIDVSDSGAGILARLTLARRVADRITQRVRHRASDSSCGLCGVETLAQTLRPLPTTERWDGEDSAVFAAFHALRDRQTLNGQTGAVHAAAACSAQGNIRWVYEDVGRHNAFDKLIGAMLRSGKSWDGGFALLSSRCSFELVEKAVLAKCPMLATISAPTRLAVERAAGAGLALRTLVRADSMLAVG